MMGGVEEAILLNKLYNLFCMDTTSGTATLENSTDEQTVLTFIADKQMVVVMLDLNALAQTTTIREYIEVDGSTARQVSGKVWPTDFDTDTKVVYIQFYQPDLDYTITLQSSTAEGADCSIQYSYATLPFG